MLDIIVRFYTYVLLCKMDMTENTVEVSAQTLQVLMDNASMDVDSGMLTDEDKQVFLDAIEEAQEALENAN